jgi:hypothetical protein
MERILRPTSENTPILAPRPESLFTSHRACFHTSAVTFEEELKYSVNGQLMTRSQVIRVHPTERTVAMWSILVDWELHRTRNYVIVDPMDPSGLLYLNHAEYLAQSKVCASNDLMLIVVARPGTQRPQPSSSPTTPSQNSPWGVEIESKWSRNSRLTWKTFLQLRNQIGKNVNLKKGSKMISEDTTTISRTVYLWVRQLAHYAEVKNPGTYIQYFIPLVRHLQVLLANNGRMAVVQHFKLSLFALYSYISGNPLKSTQPLGFGIRLTNGLPSVWPAQLREHVRRDRISIIRILASLCNLYRAMEAPHPDWDASTIEAPHPKLEGPLWEEFKSFCSNEFLQILMEHHGDLQWFEYKSAFGMVIQSAGANLSNPSISSLVLDAQAWKARGESNHAKAWFELHRDVKCSELLECCSSENHWNKEPEISHRFEPKWFQSLDEDTRNAYLAPIIRRMKDEGSYKALKGLGYPFWGTRGPVSQLREDGTPTPILGRLHSIEEPAGKVRIVAICDYFTQLACEPIHQHLFSILKGIKTDATFDQSGRVEDYFARNLSPHWSFDLKAATDTIPLALYIEVLTPLLQLEGEEIEKARERTVLWSKLLTDRDFLAPDASRFVRYGTGQPMGALSSWASMAIVHHALVQFSAYKAREKLLQWYESYLILGDDIDVAELAAVAKQYQDLCAEFRIKIGLLKSLHSLRNCFEFANRRFSPLGDISPISFKEELSAQTWTGRAEYAKRILARFGTSLKDRSSALLRKASTAAQWKVLCVELSGLRPSTISSIAKFCLLNPFATESLKELRIDTLLTWLAPICIAADRETLIHFRESTSERESLGRRVALLLASELRALLKQRISSHPLPFQVFLENKLPGGRTPAQVMSDLAGLKLPFSPLPEGAESREWRVRYMADEIDRLTSGAWRKPGEQTYGARYSIAYILWCFNQRNDKIYNDYRAWLTQVDHVLYRLSPEYEIEMGPLKEGFIDSQISKIFELWASVTGSSQVIRPNFCRPMKEWLGAEPETTPFTKGRSVREQVRVEETLRAPIRALGLAIAETLGVELPDLPYILFRRGAKWNVSLKNAIHSFIYGDVFARLKSGEELAEAISSSESSSGFREVMESSHICTDGHYVLPVGIPSDD